MIFKNFSFCILKNPFSVNSSDVVFITTDDKKQPIDEIIESENYFQLVETLKDKYNMVQIDWFAFTYSNNNNDVNINNIKKQLERECGMVYDKDFERNMEGYFSDLEYKLNMNNSVYVKNTFFENSGKDIILYNDKNPDIPSFGEKVTLFIYLFVKANFVDNYCYLEFSGDFFSKEDQNNKNFVKVYKCEFVRIDEKAGEGMILQSTKTFKEILNEMSIDFHGAFETRQAIIQKESFNPQFKIFKYEYNFFDIHKSLNKDIKLTISTQENRYKHLIELSRKIKKDYGESQSEELDIKKLKDTIDYIKSNINNKMLRLSEEEMYEEAAICKENAEKLNNLMIKLNKKKKKSISRKDYEKISCLLN